MEMRHGAIYTCKTLRMLGYLKQRGFMPFVTEPDANNGRYNVFKFYNSVELEEAIEEYFEQKTNNNENNNENGNYNEKEINNYGKDSLCRELFRLHSDDILF